jgi:CRISPR-associated endonuclease Cas2
MSRHIIHAIIAYDISCPKRLQKIYRKLCGHAIRLQYSVFYFTGTQEKYQACLDEIVPLINVKEDDLRAYPLPTNGYQWRLGKSILPEGLYYTGLPRIWKDLYNNESITSESINTPVIKQANITPKPNIENNAFFIT